MEGHSQEGLSRFGNIFNLQLKISNNQTLSNFVNLPETICIETIFKYSDAASIKNFCLSGLGFGQLKYACELYLDSFKLGNFSDPFSFDKTLRCRWMRPHERQKCQTNSKSKTNVFAI